MILTMEILTILRQSYVYILSCSIFANDRELPIMLSNQNVIYVFLLEP